jgi:tetratricopeptide (TPR) repeat protein
MKLKKYVLLFDCLAVVFFFISCGQSEGVKLRQSYYSTQCTHVDSIWQFFTVENDPSKFVQLLCNAQSNLERKGVTDSSKKLLRLMINSAPKINEARFYAYVYLNSAFDFIIKGQLDSAEYYYGLRSKHLDGADDMNILMAYQFQGNSFYVRGETDSARSAFVNGYNLARDKGDTSMIYSFALNAGTTYFDLQLTSMAAYYFSEAYVLGSTKNNVSLMLINNLAATLISENKYQEAIKLCEENQVKWSSNEKDPGAVLLKLNYSFLLNYQGEYTRAFKILNSVKVNSIPNIHLTYYYSNVLQSLMSLNKIAEFQTTIDTLSPFIYKNQPRSIVKMKTILIKAMEMKLFSPNLDSLTTTYNSELKNESDHYSSSVYCDFISGFFQFKGDNSSAELWKSRSIVHQLDLSKAKDSLKLQDVVNQITQVDLNHKLISKQKQLDDEAWKNKLIWIGLLSSMFIVCFLLLSLSLVLRNRKKKNQIFELEKTMRENEINVLQKEKELKEKTITLAQSILIQISQLIEKIKNASFSKDPDAILFRQDLERLSELSSSFTELDKTNEFGFGDYDELFEKIPSLSLLNLTERKVLILSILGSKPREIAILLNLNDQYVRNVKSKLKKSLPESLRNIEWENLKNFDQF